MPITTICVEDKGNNYVEGQYYKLNISIDLVPPYQSTIFFPECSDTFYTIKEDSECKFTKNGLLESELTAWLERSFNEIMYSAITSGFPIFIEVGKQSNELHLQRMLEEFKDSNFDNEEKLKSILKHVLEIVDTLIES